MAGSSQIKPGHDECVARVRSDGSALTCSFRGGEDAAADLVALYRFEERAEIALAEALVALALDDLEEDRADHGVGEDLQQEAFALAGGAVDQDLVAAQAGHVLAMPREAGIDRLVIGLRHRHERYVAAAQFLYGLVNAARRECDVLDAFAVIGGEILGDL